MMAVVVDTVIGNDTVKVNYTVVANDVVMVNDPIVVIDTVNVVNGRMMLGAKCGLKLSDSLKSNISGE